MNDTPVRSRLIFEIMLYLCSKNFSTMEDEDKNSGKDRIRNEGQTRDGGITYIYELGASSRSVVGRHTPLANETTTQ